MKGNIVIDCDGHVNETEEMWAEYLEPGYREQRPRIVRDNWGKELWMVEGRLYAYNPADWGAKLPGWWELAQTRIGGTDPHARLKDMDDTKIDIAVVFGALMAGLNTFTDAGLAGAMCRAYNNWVKDYCGTNPRRLKFVAYVPLHDIDEAVKELQRAVGKLGAVGVAIAPSLWAVSGKNLDDPSFYPFYAAAQELDVPVCIHDSGVATRDTAGGERMTDMFPLMHAASFPFDNMIACGRLIYGGVLDRFPRLRVAFLESGLGWVPFWLERLDAHTKMPYPLPFGNKRKPSEYIRSEQCYFSFEAEDADLPAAIQRVGAERLIWASDYPHWDAEVEGAIDEINASPAITAAVKAKILGTNAAQLYRLTL